MSKEVIKKGTEFRAVYGACQRINCRISDKFCLYRECVPERSQGYGDRGVCGTIEGKDMGILSWFTDLFTESPPEPLVFGAELRCQYGSQDSFLMLKTDNIDINDLPKACVDDCKK